MRRIFKIAASFFIVVAVLAVAKAVLLIFGFRSAQPTNQVMDRHQLVAFSISLSFCWVFIAAYIGIAWALWKHRRCGILTVYCLVALLGFQSSTGIFEIGAGLAAITLAFLALPAVRSEFIR